MTSEEVIDFVIMRGFALGLVWLSLTNETTYLNFEIKTLNYGSYIRALFQHMI